MSITIECAEKDIEDVLEEHCEDMLDCVFIKRQFKTPAGIIDMIVRPQGEKNVYLVAELKRGQIDTKAYCQVMGYANWLNNEYSNGGRRYFVPLLIGDWLHGDLADCVSKYHRADGYCPVDAYKCRYTLFRFDVMEGLSFRYACPNQTNNWRLNYEHANCPVTNQIEDFIDSYNKLRMEQPSAGPVDGKD